MFHDTFNVMVLFFNALLPLGVINDGWIGGLLHLVQRGESSLPSPLLDVPNVTAHPSAANVPTSYYSMWHYNYIYTLKGKSIIVFYAF